MRRPEVLKNVINKMMEMAGHSARYDDLLEEEDEWYMRYTITKSEAVEYKKWFDEYVKKELKLSKKRLSREWNYFWLMWGLREVDDEQE